MSKPLAFHETGTDDKPILTVTHGLDEKSVTQQLDNTGLTITCTGGNFNYTYKYHRPDVTDTKYEPIKLKVTGKDRDGDGVIKFELKPKK